MHTETKKTLLWTAAFLAATVLVFETTIPVWTYLIAIVLYVILAIFGGFSRNREREQADALASTADQPDSYRRSGVM